MSRGLGVLKGALAAFTAALTALWGWLGWLVVGWVACMAADWLTGSAAALRQGTWSSGVAREGLWRKAGCVAAVAAAALLDGVIGQLLRGPGQTVLPFDYTVFLCPLVLVWYVLTEAGSILENAGALGAPLPAWLRKAVASLRDRVDAGARAAVPASETDPPPEGGA